MQEWILKENNNEVLLHDCMITDAKLDNGNLVLTFEDGVWLLAETELNPSKDTIRTGKAQVTICLVDESQEASGVDVCMGVGLFWQKRLKLWKCWSMGEMIRCIRSNRANFEILIMHRDSVSVVFSGVCSVRKSRSFSRYEYFYWKVQTKKNLEICFEWDGVRPDCVW